MRRTVSGLLAWSVLFGPGVGGWQLLETTSDEGLQTATRSLVSVTAVLLTALASRLPVDERPRIRAQQGRGPRPQPLPVPGAEGDEGAAHPRRARA